MLSDTHIGFDWPVRPKIHRRRRGDDFYNNYLLALKPAFEKQVDLVIHGGDLLHRSRLPEYVVNRAFEPLVQIAETGIPVYIVPGNHERSIFRLTLFENHPNIFLFDHPEIYRFKKDDSVFYLCGFPFVRGDIRSEFPKIMSSFSGRVQKGKTYVLCMHHPIDGAKVGSQNFTFFKRSDTINPEDIPDWIGGVFSGHIHRYQVLHLRNAQKNIPVYYPGSVERTSFAEREEKKGYLILEISRKISEKFVQLPARPMYQLEMDVKNFTVGDLRSELNRLIAELHTETVLRLKFHNYDLSELPGELTSSLLRKMLPGSINVEFTI